MSDTPEIIRGVPESVIPGIVTEAVPIRQRDLDRISEKLAGMALPHIEKSHGGLTLLEDLPSELPFHTMGNPIPTDQIGLIAGNIDERFPAIQAAIDKAIARAPSVIPDVYEALREGSDVGLYISHGTIQDVPFGFGAFLSRFGHYEKARQQLGGEPEFDIVRGMFVSQILKRVGAVLDPAQPPIPVDHALTMLAHHIWSSFTTARSTHGLRREMPQVIKASNEAMKDSAKNVQDEKRLFFAASLEGETIKPSDNDPNIYKLGSVTDGTMAFATHKGTKGLFLAILVEEGEEGVKVNAEFTGESEGVMSGELRDLDTPDDVNEAMIGMADTCSAITSVEGRRYLYVPRKRKLAIPSIKVDKN